VRMAARDVVVIGGSAGGHAALRQLLARLPADLPAAVLAVLHLAPGANSALADILAKDSALPVVSADDGVVMERGRVYVAVPDRHLIVGKGDVLSLSRGPRENRVRPAVDALFRATARWCGTRAIGVVLSGSLDDGAAGLAAIVQCGGVALVQEPQEARFPGMPGAALAAVPAATSAPVSGLAKLISTRVGEPVGVAGDPDENLIWETDMISNGRSAVSGAGKPVGLGCPDCRGGMREVRTGKAMHYVCHVGHSWSPHSFIAAKDDGIEEALWTAVSAMQEKLTVLRSLAAGADRTGDAAAAQAHRADAERVSRSTEVLRRSLDSHG
jgi:two-component system chemotaxis response regulator CheB